MMKTTLEDYKKAVKAKYEVEKTGPFSSSLLSPSRGALRKLCFEIFKDNSNKDDLKVFSSFCGFEFSVEHRNKLSDKTDKFRKVENFFIGETDPADIETINMAAILVDFNPRPFLKFSKSGFVEIDRDEIKETIEEPMLAVDENRHITTSSQNLTIQKTKKPLNKKIIVLFILLSVLGIGYSIKEIVFPKKQCMEWQKDHYELVDCMSKTEGIGNITLKIPLDESLSDLKRIWACDTTTFFRDNKAVIWYYKTGDNKLELFNKPGFHPINQKPLRPITEYMIEKYLK
jgi:hypothetical protein